MRAKEIVGVLLKDCELLTTDEERLVEVFKAFYIVRDEIISTLSKRKAAASLVGVYRDGLTKWKSVVRHTNEGNPKIPIFDNIFGIYYATFAPQVFEILVQQKVFLGYEMSPSEKELIDTVKRQQEMRQLGQQLDAMMRRSFIDFLVGRNI